MKRITAKQKAEILREAVAKLPSRLTLTSETPQEINILGKKIKIEHVDAIRNEHTLQMSPFFDPINKARQYNVHPSGIECIQIVEHENFNVGSAIKYLWRRYEKSTLLENLRKAQYYIDREIQRIEAITQPPLMPNAGECCGQGPYKD